MCSVTISFGPRLRTRRNGCGLVEIYDYLGSGAQCGRCAHIIKRIMDEMTNGAIGPVDAMRACTLPKQRECWKTFS